MTVDSLIRTRVMTTGALFLLWLLFFGSMVGLASPPMTFLPIAQQDGPLPCEPAKSVLDLDVRPCVEAAPICAWCSQNVDVGNATNPKARR